MSVPYVCKNTQCDENTIVIQTLPPRILPKSYASPSIIADILTKKYIEHMPLYRQQQSWKRVGVKLPRNTMCNWLMTLAKECSPLYQLLREHAIRYNILYIDETTGQVLGEPGRDNRKKSYIWAYRGGPPDKPVVYYEYQESRGAEHPMRFLKDYSGFVLTDAYSGYEWNLALPDRFEEFNLIEDVMNLSQILFEIKFEPIFQYMNDEEHRKFYLINLYDKFEQASLFEPSSTYYTGYQHLEKLKNATDTIGSWYKKIR